jgi:hypothetical protein
MNEFRLAHASVHVRRWKKGVSMRRMLFGCLSVGLACTALAPAAAASVTGITSLTALGADDSIDWGQFATGAATIVGTPFTATTALGRSVGVDSELVAVAVQQQQPQEGGYGGFNPGEWLVDTQFEPSLTFTFSTPVYGVGAQVDPVEGTMASYTAEIMAYAPGGALLGTFTEPGVANETGVADGSDIFIGIKSTSGIGSVVFETSVGYNFALGTTYLSGTVPEPASWALMLIGFGGLGLTLRSRRARLQPT